MMVLVLVVESPTSHENRNNYDEAKNQSWKFLSLLRCFHQVVFDHKDISIDNDANCQETIAEIDEVGKKGKEVAESNIFTNPHSKATNSEDVADKKIKFWICHKAILLWG